MRILRRGSLDEVHKRSQHIVSGVRTGLSGVRHGCPSPSDRYRAATMAPRQPPSQTDCALSNAAAGTDRPPTAGSMLAPAGISATAPPCVGQISYVHLGSKSRVSESPLRSATTRWRATEQAHAPDSTAWPRRPQAQPSRRRHRRPRYRLNIPPRGTAGRRRRQSPCCCRDHPATRHRISH